MMHGSGHIDESVGVFRKLPVTVMLTALSEVDAYIVETRY